MDTRPRRMRALVPTLVAALVLATMSAVATASPAAADTAPANAATPATVSADALPTVQVNGVVWAQKIVGNTVYAGGEFTTATPAGATSGGVARSNMLAYDLRTGVLISAFAPVFNGVVRTIDVSPDGSRIYVGGNFNKVNGLYHTFLTALNPTTGAVISGFNPVVNSQVYAVAATSTGVYFGGGFSSVNSIARTRAAAVSLTGATLAWAPNIPDYIVRAIVISPDASKAVLGGSFSSVNGSTSPGRGMAMVDTSTGASLPWVVGQSIQNYGKDAAIYSLTSDGASVYGTAYRYNSGTGTTEGSFKASWADGSIEFASDCHGDTYSATVMDGVMYTASHAYDCSWIPNGVPYGSAHRGLAFTANATGTVSGGILAGQPAPSMLDWYPDLTAGTYTGQGQAAWSVASGQGYVVYGGEFPSVNGVKQSGLVRFATKNIAPNKEGPQLSGSNWVPAATSSVPGIARVSWGTNWDRDNSNLTYNVYRNGGTTPVYTVSKTSRQLFDNSTLAFIDTGLTAGATVTYTITATDPFGNVASSAPASVTVKDGVVSAYTSQVIKDGAADYWPLGEPSGSSSSADLAGGSNLTVGAGVSFGSAGAIFGDADTAATFSNDSSAYAVTSTQVAAPNSFSAEAWFKTTTTTGGRIIGFGNSNTAATSPAHDRQIYMDQSGTIRFGGGSSGALTVQSAAGYNDGKWHHVVATLGSDTMQLFLDGSSVATRSDATNRVAYNGYWRIGSDTTVGWPGTLDEPFDGSIDNVALYPAPLSAAVVANHYAFGTAPVNQAPTASFSATPTALSATFDGSASTDPDGTIASYAWDFGDSTSGTGATPSHTYTAAGTYPVVLTVTDNAGATATATKTVTVVAPNVAPTAAFTSTVSNLTATFDGSGSTDTDGTIATYAWDFGDSTSGTGATPTHTYTAAGTYPVVLTVTDNAGATATATKTVTVVAPNVAPTAAFTSTVSNLTATFDGSGSTDTDGTIATYAWDFGDSTSGTGATPTHTYTAAGTYTVTLTVTDNAGATATKTAAVTVTAPAPAHLGQDAFGRTVASGLGTADTGGAWTVSSAASLSVGSGVASAKVAAGSTVSAYLNSVSPTATNVTTTLTLPALPAGGSLYAGVVGRRVGTHDYNARVTVAASGTVTVSVLYDGTALKTATVTGVTAKAGTVLHVRLQTAGSGTTTLQARAWIDGSVEPTAWQVTATDTTAAMQTAGSVGIRGYLGAGVTNGPLVVTFDDFLADQVN